ncbi:leucine rich repeat protein [Pelomyxa schiedti]|nr:leucine rich repeat protein [Pelomyxa schiedti]
MSASLSNAKLEQVMVSNTRKDGTSVDPRATVSMANFNITRLPDNLQRFHWVVSLDVQDNFLTCIPDGIGCLVNVQTIIMSCNRIRQISPDIGQLTRLRELWLHDNEVVSVPESISRLRYLKFLDLDNNRLQRLPNGLCCLESLQGLFLRGNRIRQLPSGLGFLPNIRSLQISGNLLPPRLMALPTRSLLLTLQSSSSIVTIMVAWKRRRPAICRVSVLPLYIWQHIFDLLWDLPHLHNLHP